MTRRRNYSWGFGSVWCGFKLGTMEDLLSEIRLPWFEKKFLHAGILKMHVWSLSEQQSEVCFGLGVYWLEDGECEGKCCQVPWIIGSCCQVAILTSYTCNCLALALSNPLFYPKFKFLSRIPQSLTTSSKNFHACTRLRRRFSILIRESSSVVSTKRHQLY